MRRAREWLAGHEGAAVAAGMAALALFYLITTVPNIANHPIAGGDEGWIISASAKLAEEGVFGSDLFEGFYGAEKRYYFNLPLHHLILTGVFEVFGVGLEQARLTSSAFGLAALALTFALGRRIGGPWAGLASAALLVLLRLNLAPFTGLTLTDLGATVRYDLVAVPFALVAVLVLLPRTGEVSARRAVLGGLVLGLGCLVQFIDALFIAPLALFLLTLSLPWKDRLLRAGLFGLAVVVTFLPYFVYIAQDYEAFERQASSVEQERDFLSPSFYLDNLGREWQRYDIALDLDAPNSLAEITERPSARLALLLTGPLALAYTLVRARRGSGPHRLLALVLLALLVEFALFESTKRFVYWVAVAPFLCVAIGNLTPSVPLSVARRGGRAEGEGAEAGGASTGAGEVRAEGRGPRAAGLISAGLAVFLLVAALEGLAVGAGNVLDAREAPSYAAAGEEVRALVPAGSTLVTDNRLWLTLGDMEVRSLLLLFYWTNPDIAGDEVTDVDGAMARIDADYLLLSPLTREILGKLSPDDSARFQSYMAARARLVGTVSRPPYGPIEVYELR